VKLIQGTLFKELAQQYSHTRRGFRLEYAHTHDTKDLFDNIRKDSENLYVCITHNSDGCVIRGSNRPYDIDPLEMPRNVVKLYSQNVCYNDDRIIPLGIFLENSYCFPSINKLEQISRKRNSINLDGDRPNLVYMNFNPTTNPATRTPVYEYFKQFDWVTVDCHPNGFRYESFLDNLATHRYVLCPPGNGASCHREFEASYLGCIPIMLSCINNREFEENMPIVAINDWREVDERYLESFYVGVNLSELYDNDMLDFNYWKERILNT